MGRRASARSTSRSACCVARCCRRCWPGCSCTVATASTADSARKRRETPTQTACRTCTGAGPDSTSRPYPEGVYSGQRRRLMAGYIDDKDRLLKRLRRVEGQVRGLQRLVENDTYCIDVLTQVSAATKALQAVAVELVEDHLSHCVADAVQTGGDEADAKVQEATAAIARLLRT